MWHSSAKLVKKYIARVKHGLQIGAFWVLYLKVIYHIWQHWPENRQAGLNEKQNIKDYSLSLLVNTLRWNICMDWLGIRALQTGRLWYHILSVLFLIIGLSPRWRLKDDVQLELTRAVNRWTLDWHQPKWPPGQRWEKYPLHRIW